VGEEERGALLLSFPCDGKAASREAHEKPKNEAGSLAGMCPVSALFVSIFLFCSSALLKFLGMDFQNIKII